MTILCALAALFFAALWYRARRWEIVADGWEDAATLWKDEAMHSRELAEQCQANAEAALQLANDWKDAALLLQAAMFQPLRGYVYVPGKMQ